ncbi:MAG: 50S ribosomal protein L25 [Bryobacteraceae bacterium]
MRRDITVTAEVRSSRGKNEARRLRQALQIPAVVYGSYKDSVPISIKPKDLIAVLKTSSGQNTIFDLAIADGETTPVMVVDLQRDPIRGTLLHADLKRIDLSKRLRVTVPISYHGEAKGVKTQSGLFEVVDRNVEIECLPDEIPEHFDLNISELLIGQAIRASELPITGSMKLLSAADSVLVHVIAPRGTETAEAEPAVEAAKVAEPEVIKKGKKEEEGAEKKK